MSDKNTNPTAKAVSDNPFTRRRFNVPTAQSPLTQEPESAPKEPVKDATPTVHKVAPTEGEVSDREDNGDTLPEIDPKDPTKKAYKDEDVLPMLDALLQHGYALSTFKLRDKEIILRTRFTWEEQYIYQHLEASHIQTALNYQREYAFITIAASIVKYGDYVFEPKNQGKDDELIESIAKRYEFVRSLNSVITDIIQLKLQEFDDKQRYIIAHFDDLLKAF